MNTIGTRLKELRESKNLTPKALSISLAGRNDINLNVSRETIDKWERGERTPNAEAVRALALYFGVTTDYLLGLDDYWSSHDNLSITAVTLGFSDKATDNLLALRSAEGGIVSDTLSLLLESPQLLETLKVVNKSRADISRQIHYCEDYAEKYGDNIPRLFIEQAIDMADMYIIKSLRAVEVFLRDALGYTNLINYQGGHNGEHTES